MIDEDDLPNQELLPMIYLYIVFCIIILIFKIIVFYHIVSLSVDSSTDTVDTVFCMVLYKNVICIISVSCFLSKSYLRNFHDHHNGDVSWVNDGALHHHEERSLQSMNVRKLTIQMTTFHVWMYFDEWWVNDFFFENLNKWQYIIIFFLIFCIMEYLKDLHLEKGYDKK